MVYLIALVPAVLVYLVAATTRSRKALFWAGCAAFFFSLAGSPAFLFVDLGFSIAGFLLAWNTVDFEPVQSNKAHKDNHIGGWSKEPSESHSNSDRLEGYKKLSEEIKANRKKMWDERGYNEKDHPHLYNSPKVVRKKANGERK